MTERYIIVICKQEGCSGISYVGEFDTVFSAKAMAEDINAVARAAARKGVKTVVYSPREIRWVKASCFYRDYVDQEVVVANGATINNYLENCDGVVALGTPAMAGTENAFSCGTHNHVAIHDYFLAGEKVGEIAIYRTYAARYNLPLLAVIGDEAVCAEAKATDENAFTFVTKTARSRNKATCKAVEESRKGIEECVFDALEKKDTIFIPTISFPLVAEVSYNRTDFCDDAIVKTFYAIKRTGARSATKTLNDLKYVYELFI